MKHRLPTVTIIVIVFFIASFPMAEADNQTGGLQQNDKESSCGYTLFAPIASTSTYLINNNGQLVHSWESFQPQVFSAYLLENGHLLRTANFNTLLRGGFQEMAWDGEIIWEYECFGHHHDIEPLPNGNVMLIVEEIVSGTRAISLGRNPELLRNAEALPRIAGIPISSDRLPKDNFLLIPSILEIKKTGPKSGTVVWEWHLSDHVVQDYDENMPNYGVVAEHPELVDINFIMNNDPNWIHANAIDHHPQYDQVMITTRNFSEIWVIDHSTTTEEAAGHKGDLLYRWGNPVTHDSGTEEDQKLFGPHDGQWIEPGLPGGGNILIFNNGVWRPGKHYSSVVEIENPVESTGHYSKPPTGAPYKPENEVWVYTAQPPQSFFSGIMSGVQRLPNGNTLICSATEATLFEVSPEGQTVWKYLSPPPVRAPMFNLLLASFNSICKSRRYPADYPGLAGENLAPKGPVEHYDSTSKMTLQSLPGGLANSPYGGTPAYGQGQVATILAIPGPLHEFTGWEVRSGSVNLHNPDEAWTSFTMGNRDAVIRADFALKSPAKLFSFWLSIFSITGTL